jgi:hypothetical protein
MTILVEDIGKFLGRPVQNPYRSAVGKLIGLDANIRNEVTQIKVERASGELAKYPVGQIRVENGSVVIVPEWKDEAANLEREYVTASRRMSALKSLLADGDIDTPTYKEMTSEYESAIRAMESRRVSLIDSLKERAGQLEERIRGLQLSLTDDKLLYSSGVVDATAYKEACQAIHEMRDGHLAEKKDVEVTMETLARLESNTLPQPPAESQPVEQRIPDFVVVRVSEEAPA